MATSRDLLLLDQLVTTVEASWDHVSPHSVSREYLGNISEKELNTFEGRRVYLFPVEYQKESDNRFEDRFGYGVAVTVIERYEDADKATSAAVKEWLDERLDFVETSVIDALDFGKGTVLRFGTREVWTESIECPLRYDVDLLAEKKLFRCDVRFMFRELLS